MGEIEIPFAMISSAGLDLADLKTILLPTFSALPLPVDSADHLYRLWILVSAGFSEEAHINLFMGFLSRKRQAYQAGRS
jgi:hypothetical protein